MKHLKPWICALLILVVLGGMSVSYAAQEVASGTCGADLTWVLTDDGVLTISGEGAMSNYKSPEFTRNGIMPWYDSRDSIKKL